MRTPKLRRISANCPCQHDHYSECLPCFVMDFGVRMLDRKDLNWCTPFFALSQCLWSSLTMVYGHTNIFFSLAYRNLPIKGAPIIRAPPKFGGSQQCQNTKMTRVSLIFVWFSIRNQRWKANNVSFVPRLLDLTLLERPAPLLGRLRYLIYLP